MAKNASFYSKKLKQTHSIKFLTKVTTASVLSLSLLACSGKTTEEHMQAAQAFIDEGNNQAAIVELKNAVQQSPQLASARYELGRIYLELQDFESAEKELSKALELGASASQVIPLLSKAYQRTGANVALSQIDLSTDGLSSADKLEVGFRKLQSLIQLQKVDDAKRIIGDLKPIESSSVYRGLVDAIEHLINEDLPSAIDVSEKMLEISSLNRDVLSFTARLYLLNNQTEAATALYEDYVKVAPTDLQIKFTLANMLIEQGLTEKAERYIDELLAVNNQNGLLNQLKSVARAAASDHTAALQFAEQAILGGRTEPTVRLVAGFSAYQLGEFEKAVQQLSYIANDLPSNHPGLRILAASQLQLNMGQASEEVLSRIDNVSANDAGLFSRAGYELLREGDELGARKLIEQVENVSQSADDLTRLGVLKLSLNDVEGLLNLEEAVTKAPESVTTRSTLASAYLSTNQLEKALQLAKEWQAQAPASPDGYLLEADVLQRQNNYLEALNLIEKASSLNADTVNIELAKMRIYLRSEDETQAKVAAEKVLKEQPANIVALGALFAIEKGKNNADVALNRILDAINNDQENTALRMLGARILLVEKNFARVLELLEDINPDKTAPMQYWSLKGTALLRLNELNDADAHYAEWSRVYPNQENATLGRLLILDGKREFSKALEVADQFLSIEENIQIRLIRTYLLVMNNRVGDAKQALSNIDSQYQQLPFLRGVKARIALMENKPSDALEDARAAYAATQNLDNLLLLVRSLDLTNQREESLQIIKGYTEKSPQDERGLVLLAERQINSDTNSATQTYEKLIEANPNNFVALNNLAYLLMQEGQLERASALAKRAFDIQPQNVATADTYAQVLVKQNNVQEAVDIYKRVMSESVDNEEVILNYIEALLLNKEIELAKRQLQRHSFSLDVSKTRLENLKTSYNI